ncbi:hypothetical protein GCM10011610_69550 [Nocardia rhizosphaerihabitans]|uniref:Molybdopterin oxidoreductase domain-containing protein n=1 Tax=Nocardia rhizosphaerihabitans TaxID=1691570 RepID=A0ABQ2L304_9NOCA|nr:hypothetical protein GCM10011610_69550 [Nocardia rhizosphaerihabitans]
MCPKSVALADLRNDPDRLRRPMRKVDGNWVEISWTEAIDAAAAGLAMAPSPNSEVMPPLSSGPMASIRSQPATSTGISAMKTLPRFLDTRPASSTVPTSDCVSVACRASHRWDR